MAVVYLTPVFDTYVYNKLPDKNFSRDSILYVGYKKPDNIYRSLLKFNLCSIPLSAYISRSILRLFLCNDDYNFTKCIDIHRIVSSYDEETVSYNSQPDFLPKYESSAVLPYEKPQFVEWDVTQLAKGWHSGGIVNYGIMLKSRSERFPSLVSFSSLQCDYSPNVPLLLVEFYDNDLFSSSDTYSSSPTPQYSKVFNTFCFKVVTFFVINQGLSNVTVSVEVSPDCVNWYEEKSKMNVPPGKTTALVPQIFGKYTRLKFFTEKDRGSIQIHMQGQC